MVLNALFNIKSANTLKEFKIVLKNNENGIIGQLPWMGLKLY